MSLVSEAAASVDADVDRESEQGPARRASAVARTASRRLASWSGTPVFVAILALWSLLPTGRAGAVSLAGWGDQTLFLKALQEVQSSGRSAISEAGSVGPAYLAAGRVVSRVFGLEPGPALILLNRFAFLAIVACVLGAALHRRRGRAQFHLPVLIALGVVVLATPWRLYSDIPWTHAVASAGLLIAVSSLRAVPTHPVTAGLVLGAATVGLLQTRSYEGRALIAATVLALAGAALIAAVRMVRRRRSVAELRAPRWWPALPAAVAGGAAVLFAVAVLTGQRGFFQQYAAKGQQSSAAAALDLESVPAKAVQLFVDPCYRSLCPSLTNYSPQGVVPDSLLNYWQQPLLMQLPFLLLAAYAVVLAVGHRLTRRLSIPLDVQVAVLAAGALVLGYTANPVGGGAHLKYGFVRDFTAPFALLLYAAGRSAVLAWSARDTSGRDRPRRSPRRFAVSAVVLLGAVVATVPGFWLPRVSPVLVDYRLAADGGCATDFRAGCDLELEGVSADGRVHALGDRAVLVLQCDKQRVGALVADGILPDTVTVAAQSCRSKGGQLAVQYLPVDLGVYQTPEGVVLLEKHVLRPAA
jgi:hypothetical protein